MACQVLHSFRYMLILLIIIVGNVWFILQHSSNLDLMKRQTLLRNNPLNYCEHMNPASQGKHFFIKC